MALDGEDWSLVVDVGDVVVLVSSRGIYRMIIIVTQVGSI